MSTTQAQSSLFPSSGAKPLALTHTAIIGLSVAAFIAVLGFTIAMALLCSSCCGRRRRVANRQVLDDRNEFPAWNPNAPGPLYEGRGDGFEMQPLTKAAVRPAGAEDVHPGEPVVVDDADLAAPRFGAGERKSTRYYSGWRDTGAWKRLSRFSQIGRAY